MSIYWSSAIVHYKIESSAGGTMQILYSPLEGSWLKKDLAAPSSSARVALLIFSFPVALIL